MKRIKSIKEMHPKVSIGIMGQSRGLGVTHLSIALANYIAKRLHAKVALIEYGEQNTLVELSDSGEAKCFYRQGVDYYPDVTSAELGLIYNMDYEYFILDLGADSRIARQEILRCDGKLIVGSLCPWRKETYYEYIENLEEEMGNRKLYTFLCLFEDKIEIKRCRRTFKVQVKSIPFIANPFQVREEQTIFLHSLI